MDVARAYVARRGAESLHRIYHRGGEMLCRSLAAAALAVLVAAPAQAQLFNFEGVDSPPGTLTPFSLTRSGLTATL